MFNLEHSMGEWRRQMQGAGVRNPAVLDELESHLREDIQKQMRSGLGAEKAFENAVQSIGQPAALRNEFAKSASMAGRRWQKFKYVVLSLLGVSPPTPQIFTTGALESLEGGCREALTFHHDFVGTEHILLGLLEAETGTIRRVLEKLGVQRDTVRREIVRIVGPGAEMCATGALRYTPRAKKALEFAGAEATFMNQNVDTGHIFLGLLKEGSGVAPLVLKKLGLNFQEARAAVLQELKQPHSDT